MTNGNSPNRKRHQGFATDVIASGYPAADAYGAINMPIYRNAAFEYADSKSIADAFQGRTANYTYSRISNPTVTAFEAKIRAASGAEHVIALSSGMAAITNTFFALAYNGCNIVTSPHLFGNTFSFFKFTLANFGIEIRFVDTDDLNAVAAAIDDKTIAVFAEMITNPHLEIADLAAISRLVKPRNIPLIVDTTVVPWFCYDARSLGIDIEVVSTTKYISGGATSLGGAIIDYGTYNGENNPCLMRIATPPAGISRFSQRLRAEIARNLGATITPDTAYLQSLGMETLKVRYDKLTQTTYDLAVFLSGIPNIASVNYPELSSSPYKALSDSMFGAMHPGAMLTLTLSSEQACFDFMDKLKLIRIATNMFDNKTLVIHPYSTIYGTFTPELKATMGIQPNILRFSIGLEDIEDLKQDILQALN